LKWLRAFECDLQRRASFGSDVVERCLEIGAAQSLLSTPLEWNAASVLSNGRYSLLRVWLAKLILQAVKKAP
ncbi:MAG: hypothetical protein ABI946_11820, partial [Chthoniobacterales bacterium]